MELSWDSAVHTRFLMEGKLLDRQEGVTRKSTLKLAWGTLLLWSSACCALLGSVGVPTTPGKSQIIQNTHCKMYFVQPVVQADTLRPE